MYKYCTTYVRCTAQNTYLHTYITCILNGRDARRGRIPNVWLPSLPRALVIPLRSKIGPVLFGERRETGYVVVQQDSILTARD
jgi:hypothetical protein